MVWLTVREWKWIWGKSCQCLERVGTLSGWKNHLQLFSSHFIHHFSTSSLTDLIKEIHENNTSNRSALSFSPFFPSSSNWSEKVFLNYFQISFPSFRPFCFSYSIFTLFSILFPLQQSKILPLFFFSSSTFLSFNLLLDLRETFQKGQWCDSVPLLWSENQRALLEGLYLLLAFWEQSWITHSKVSGHFKSSPSRMSNVIQFGSESRGSVQSIKWHQHVPLSLLHSTQNQFFSKRMNG